MSSRERRVKVVAIHPHQTRLEDLADKGAFLGVSISNPMMRTPSVRFFLEWANFHFRPVDILIGDWIERHNLNPETENDTERSCALAMAKAEPVVTAINEAKSRIPEIEMKLVSARDVAMEPKFNSVLSILTNHFESDAEFRSLVLTDVHDYLARNQKRKPQTHALAIDTSVAHSVQYVLEELAIFSLLMERGLDVQLYPGRHLATLVALANKQISSPIYGLNHLICIDLSLSR